MSEQLHPTRLEWDGRRGIARHDGVQIVLHQPPSRNWYEVHYTPGLQADIRDTAVEPRRDMTSDEIRAVQRFLAHMAYASRVSIGHDTRVQASAPHTKDEEH